MMKWPLRLSFCLLLLPFHARASVLDFEGLPDSVALSEQLAAQGVRFRNAVTLSAGYSLNESDFPPHSGSMVVGDDGNGPLQIFFSYPVDDAAAWFTFASRLSVRAFDAAGVLRGEMFSGDSSNLGDSLWLFTGLHQISRLDISAATPASFVMDDLSFLPNAVPAPGTLALLVAGLIGLAGRRARA